ncbi:MAG: PEP-CTERM sorting domain-containing protein [Burkholderiales bacterium]|nr:PEP-CTERM sorting domain-containing protein [Burkholderiales bacterium]
MHRIRHGFAVAAFAASALLAAPAAHAVSILGDTFDVTADIDGTTGGGTAVAGSGAGDVRSVHVFWVDGDSFDVVIKVSDNAPGGAPDLGSIVITLSGLDFPGHSILGASFNGDASDYFGYLASPDNPTGSAPIGGPSVATTATSVTVTMSSFSAQLVGDQPTFRFDVRTVVPEPGTVAATLIGLGLLGAGMRRRSQSQVATR